MQIDYNGIRVETRNERKLNYCVVRRNCCSSANFWNPGDGNDNPLHCSYLQSMWSQSQTWLNTHTCNFWKVNLLGLLPIKIHTAKVTSKSKHCKDKNSNWHYCLMKCFRASFAWFCQPSIPCVSLEHSAQISYLMLIAALQVSTSWFICNKVYIILSDECMLLGSVSSQQRFGVTDIKALSVSQLSGLGQTML